MKKIIILLVLFSGTITCFGQYHVYYNGNGNDGGTPPVDTNTYSTNDTAMVKWEVPLTNTGYTFACWNTQADGSGVNYSPDAYSSGPTLQIQNSDVTLYAQWGNCSQTDTTNYALNFNEGQFMGNDDTFESVMIGDLPNFTNAITVEAWINPSTFDTVEGHNNPVILKFYTEDVYIGLKNDGGNHILSWNGWDAYGSTDIPANQWTHVAFVVNNSGLQAMYINGNPESFTGNTATPPTSIDWVIGNMTWSASPYRWHGMIDEIRIWNTERTASEIQNFYDKKLNGNEQGLVIYWDFDKSSATQLLCDHNLNGTTYTGLLRNMENTDWVAGVPLQPLSIHDNINNNHFTVYPNPTQDIIKITSDNELIGKEYILQNILGSTIKKGELNANKIISVKEIKKGIYFLTILDNTNKQTQKIIIQ